MKTVMDSWSKLVDAASRVAHIASRRFSQLASRFEGPGEFARAARSEEDLT